MGTERNIQFGFQDFHFHLQIHIHIFHCYLWDAANLYNAPEYDDGSIYDIMRQITEQNLLIRCFIYDMQFGPNHLHFLVTFLLCCFVDGFDYQWLDPYSCHFSFLG